LNAAIPQALVRLQNTLTSGERYLADSDRAEQVLEPIVDNLLNPAPTREGA